MGENRIWTKEKEKRKEGKEGKEGRKGDDRNVTENKEEDKNKIWQRE